MLILLETIRHINKCNKLPIIVGNWIIYILTFENIQFSEIKPDYELRKADVLRLRLEEFT